MIWLQIGWSYPFGCRGRNWMRSGMMRLRSSRTLWPHDNLRRWNDGLVVVEIKRGVVRVRPTEKRKDTDELFRVGMVIKTRMAGLDYFFIFFYFLARSKIVYPHSFSYFMKIPKQDIARFPWHKIIHSCQCMYYFIGALTWELGNERTLPEFFFLPLFLFSEFLLGYFPVVDFV